jgi:hypothetical protein
MGDIRGSNPLPLEPQSNALPNELIPPCVGSHKGFILSPFLDKQVDNSCLVPLTGFEPIIFEPKSNVLPVTPKGNINLTLHQLPLFQ